MASPRLGLVVEDEPFELSCTYLVQVGLTGTMYVHVYVLYMVA